MVAEREQTHELVPSHSLILRCTDQSASIWFPVRARRSPRGPGSRERALAAPLGSLAGRQTRRPLHGRPAGAPVGTRGGHGWPVWAWPGPRPRPETCGCVWASALRPDSAGLPRRQWPASEDGNQRKGDPAAMLGIIRGPRGRRWERRAPGSKGRRWGAGVGTRARAGRRGEEAGCRRVEERIRGRGGGQRGLDVWPGRDARRCDTSQGGLTRRGAGSGPMTTPRMCVCVRGLSLWVSEKPSVRRESREMAHREAQRTRG